MNILYDARLDGELPDNDKQQVLATLSQALPSMTLLHREEDLRPFECDGLSAYRVLPMLVALPDTLDQVETLLRTCHLRVALPFFWLASTSRSPRPSHFRSSSGSSSRNRLGMVSSFSPYCLRWAA